MWRYTAVLNTLFHTDYIYVFLQPLTLLCKHPTETTECPTKATFLFFMKMLDTQRYVRDMSTLAWLKE